MRIPIEISARHVHLSQEDLEKLFGKGYSLKKFKSLYQPSDFAARETIDIIKGQKIIKNVRVVGPVRSKTQVELSKTDAIFLKMEVPFRHSGRLKNTPGVILKGPKGKVFLKEGVIIPLRHIHCSTKEAKKLGFKEGDVVSLKVFGKRSVVFHNVKIRIKENFKLCCHLDTDEGNACGIYKKGWGEIVKE